MTQAQSPRHSVTRNNPSNTISLGNLTAGYLANRILGGRKVTIDEAEELLNGLGITNLSPAEVLQKANTIANFARKHLSYMIEIQPPNLEYTLAQIGAKLSLQESKDKGGDSYNLVKKLLELIIIFMILGMVGIILVGTKIF